MDKQTSKSGIVWIRPIGTPIIQRPEAATPSNGLERRRTAPKPSRPPFMSLSY